MSQAPKEFNDFAREAKPLEGSKVRIDDIINRKILVLDYKIRDSRFEKKNCEKCLTLQFEMEGVKHGYEENRRVLVEGLPKAGLDRFLPVDGAFYLYADVSRFSSDSFDFAKRMLEETHVATTPGVDFDPVNGRSFVRLCYAGSTAEMHEAVERIGRWLRNR